MKRYNNTSPLLNILRILLGLLFVFSGFVKCIDPTGGAIKIEDYFVAWGLDVPFSVDMALSLIQNVLEFTAGFLLLFDLFVPISSLVVLAFMVVFTPLTLYIAIADPVSDCGCFGDAVKLTNWQTFFKNLIFLPMAIIVFAYRKNFHSRLTKGGQMSAALIGIITAVIISFTGISNEPLIDFRPFAVGTDIHEAMSVPADAEQPEYRTTFIMEKDGVQQEFDEFNYPYGDSTWVFIDSKLEVIKEGYVPPIKDFTLTDTQGNAMTGMILSSSRPVMLAISPNILDVGDEEAQKLLNLSRIAAENEYMFFIASASPEAHLHQFESQAGAGFDFVQGDETMLKTITRSNPGIIVIQNGVIVAKYHINHLPYDRELANPTAAYLTNIESQYARLFVISLIFALGILLITIYKYHRQK